MWSISCLLLLLVASTIANAELEDHTSLSTRSRTKERRRAKKGKGSSGKGSDEPDEPDENSLLPPPPDFNDQSETSTPSSSMQPSGLRVPSARTTMQPSMVLSDVPPLTPSGSSSLVPSMVPNDQRETSTPSSTIQPFGIRVPSPRPTMQPSMVASDLPPLSFWDVPSMEHDQGENFTPSSTTQPSSIRIPSPRPTMRPSLVPSDLQPLFAWDVPSMEHDQGEAFTLSSSMQPSSIRVPSPRPTMQPSMVLSDVPPLTPSDFSSSVPSMVANDQRETSAPSSSVQPTSIRVPSPVPSDLPPLIPSDVIPSDISSLAPSVVLTSAASGAIAYVAVANPNNDNPNGSSSYVCKTDAALDALDDTINVQVQFTYQIWVEPEVDLATVVDAVEQAMIQAVADQLLTCDDDGGDRRRRLLTGVRGISALPKDVEVGSCDTASTECHRISVSLTAQTTGEPSALDVSCAAVQVVQDSSTLVRIVSSIDGVEALLFEGSTVTCSGSDQEEGTTESEVQDAGTRVNDGLDEGGQDSVSAAVAVGATLASAMVVFILFAVAHRRQDRAQTVKESYSIHAANTMMTSPTSTNGVGAGSAVNVEYANLPEDDEYYGQMQLIDIDLDDGSSSKDDSFSPMDESRLVVEEGQEADWVGSVPVSPGKLLGADPVSPEKWDTKEKNEPQSPDSDDDDDIQAMMQAAERVDLSDATREKKKARRKRRSKEDCYESCLGSGPPMTPIKEDDGSSRSGSSGGGSPAMLGSLLNNGASSPMSLPEDRACVQLFEGYAQVLKVGDLEAANLSTDEWSI